MAEVHSRLIRCFSSVFPTLTEAQIQSADFARLIDLDSLAAVTLVTVVDEELGVEMDLDALLMLGSFAALCQHLSEEAVSSASRSTED